VVTTVTVIAQVTAAAGIAQIATVAGITVIAQITAATTVDITVIIQIAAATKIPDIAGHPHHQPGFLQRLAHRGLCQGLGAGAVAAHTHAGDAGRAQRAGRARREILALQLAAGEHIHARREAVGRGAAAEQHARVVGAAAQQNQTGGVADAGGVGRGDDGVP